VPNVRAAADPANPKATVDVAGVTLDQVTSINLDTTDGDVKAALKAGLITAVDREPYDEDESKAQIAELEERRAATAAAAAPTEPAAEEEDDDEAPRPPSHTTTQRHRSSRST
jgi:hypothetical protein